MEPAALKNGELTRSIQKKAQDRKRKFLLKMKGRLSD